MRYTHFSKTERLELSILLKKGYSQRQIASEFGRSPSSVSRELRRNSVKGQYDPDKAQHRAYVKRRYSKYQGMKIRNNPWLEDYIWDKIMDKWSPEQIAGRLKREFGFTVVSHRAIYKYLYSVYGEPLCQYLKYKQKKPRKRKEQPSKRGQIIKDRIFIDQRPNMVNHRRRRGDFEGDSLGSPKSGIETVAALVDRKSRYLLARKISRPKYAVDAFKELLASTNRKRSLTLDNASEHARYKELKLPTYFCHPYTFWEKGTIENTFGIIREYIPKKSRLENYSQEQIDVMIDQMNNTPRKCLSYRTPTEVFERKSLPTINPRVLHLRV